MMRFGVVLPHRWTYASSHLLREFSREAEELGYDSLWVTDHIFVPPSHVERGHIFYEALTTLSYVSAFTEKVGLGTAVLHLPARNPVIVAKQVATLDVLSGGRVVLGVGVGWIREELEGLGVRWEERGRRIDEAIRVMKTLWREGETSSFKGRYTRFENMLFHPKPSQRGGPPILVGGMSKAALKRAATLGDGWIPWAITPQELSAGINTIRGMGGQGKTIALVTPINLEEDSPKEYVGVLGERHHILGGTTREVMDEIEEYAGRGLHHLILSFRDIRLFKDRTPEKILQQMRLFAREILPSFRK